MFAYTLLNNLTRESFWMDGKSMIIVCIIISLLFTLLLGIITKGFKKGWKLLLPVLICIPIICFGIIMLLLPNGTGVKTQIFYLGVVLYAVWTLIFTIIEELLAILFIKIAL